MWDRQWSYIYHEYPRPRPLAAITEATAGLWDLPIWPRPNWCHKLIGENADKWAKLPNHPCAFWDDEYGPIADNMHAGAMVGNSSRTAMRLADAARTLLQTRLQLSRR